jgi:hypothetical protein
MEKEQEAMKARPVRMHTVESLQANAIPEPNTGCWLWMGAITGLGYAYTSIKSRAVRAHRLMFEVAHGPVEPGNDVCHRCDVRACINPSHLFQATHRENMLDMAQKGRANTARGESQGNSRLTRAQVLAIRSAVSGGESKASVARRYGVTHSCIQCISSRINWRHVKESK